MSVDTDPHQHGYISDKERYLGRMKRIEGQARGIAKMIDEEKYCIDILTQVSALTRALQGVDGRGQGFDGDVALQLGVGAERAKDEDRRGAVERTTGR